MYKPDEDSFLLKKYVNKLAKGKILEVGVGSGYQIEHLKNAEGVDIDKKSIEYCQKKGLKVYYSNLFSNVSGKYDTIIFNPPYLPQEGKKEHKDLFGGKRGWEIIERFFKQVKEHLEPKGIILILFSNITNKTKVDSIIKENNFKFEQLDEKSVGLMEKLYVYLCS